MTEFRMGRFQAIPPVVKNLIIINVLVFLAQISLDSTYGITNYLMLYPFDSEAFKGYQIFTHMFAHGGFLHILFNMFVLWMFGSVLERVWGPRRFLIFYLVCGLGSAFLHLLIQHFRYEQAMRIYEAGNQAEGIAIASSLGPALGASGAIMGLFTAFGYLFPNSELIILPIPFPIKAKWAVLLLMGFDLFGGIAGRDNIAHFAHLGGAITGLLIVWIWNRTNRQRFY